VDDSTDELQRLRRRLAEFARVRDWEQFHTPKNLAMALIAEAAEVVEHLQWKEAEAELAPAEREAIAEELADVLIYLVRLADRLEVDLARAAWAKIERNESRFPVDRVRGRAGRGVDFTD